MDNRTNCLKQRKRAQDKANQQISVSAQKPASIDFYFSRWASGDAKKLFVPVAGELVPECLKRHIDSLQDSNSCEAAWAHVVDTHDKDCKTWEVLRHWKLQGSVRLGLQKEESMVGTVCLHCSTGSRLVNDV